MPPRVSCRLWMGPGLPSRFPRQNAHLRQQHRAVIILDDLRMLKSVQEQPRTNHGSRTNQSINFDSRLSACLSEMPRSPLDFSQCSCVHRPEDIRGIVFSPSTSRLEKQVTSPSSKRTNWCARSDMRASAYPGRGLSQGKPGRRR